MDLKQKTSRKSVIESAYNHAVKNDLHVNDAAIWASEQYGKRISKGEVQYWAMKAKKPYLDELRGGVRTIIK
jgi:hypothetical protein